MRLRRWALVAIVAFDVASAKSAEAQTKTSSTAPAARRAPVTFRSQPIFYIAGDDATRTRRLSEALRGAIDAPARAHPDAPNIEIVRVSSSTVALRVRGYVIGDLYSSDAAPAQTFDAYVAELAGGLELFVQDQRRKAALQGSALRVFFAALIIVIGLLVLRLARYLFKRADESIDDRAAAMKPITLLGVPIIGPEALGAAAALAVALGRITAYVGIIVATISLSLWQFELARGWVGAFLKWASTPLVGGLEELLKALPRLGLAALLIAAGNGALRVIRVLFDSAASGRTTWALNPDRARVLRTVASVAVVLVITPLAIASVFGQFHSPLEVLLIACAATFALAFGPLLASGAVGLSMLWRGPFEVGDRIGLGAVRGKVVRVSPWDVEIDGDDGRKSRVPMLALLSTTVEKMSAARPSILRATVKRNGSIGETLSKVLDAVREPTATIACVGFDESVVKIELRTASDRAERAMLAMAEGAEGVAILECARVE
jgi:small-conductance mechanosensitive channel